MSKLFTFFSGVISEFTSNKHWKFSVASICVVYCIITSMPNYLNFSENSLKKSPYYKNLIENYQTLYNQADHPFQQQKVDINSHSSKLAFRFIPALILHYIPVSDLLRRMLCLYVINNIVGFIFFVCLLSLSFKYSQDKLFSTLIAFNFAVLYIGKSFFHDTYLWNDGIAFTLLISSLLTRHTILILVCLLGAYFTDERAIFGGILVYVYQKITSTDKSTSFITNSDIPYVVSFILYLLIRITLNQYFGLSTPSGSQSKVSLFFRFKADHSIFINMIGFLLAYKMAWLLLITSVWWLRKKIFLLSVYVLVILAVIVSSFSVEDLTRTLSYSFIALLLGFFLFFKKYNEAHRKSYNYITFALVAVNFCIPTVSIMGDVVKFLPPIDKLIERILST